MPDTGGIRAEGRHHARWQGLRDEVEALQQPGPGAVEWFDAVPTFANPGRSREPLAGAIDDGLRRGEGGRVEVKDELGAAVGGVAAQADRQGRGGVGEEVDDVGADPEVERDHFRSRLSPHQCRLRPHGSGCCDVSSDKTAPRSMTVPSWSLLRTSIRDRGYRCLRASRSSPSGRADVTAGPTTTAITTNPDNTCR